MCDPTSFFNRPHPQQQALDPVIMTPPPPMVRDKWGEYQVTQEHLDRNNYTKDGEKLAADDPMVMKTTTATPEYWMDQLRSQRELAAKSGSTGDRGFSFDLGIRLMEAMGFSPDTIEYATEPGEIYKKAHPGAQNVLYKRPPQVDPVLEQTWGKYLDAQKRK